MKLSVDHDPDGSGIVLEEVFSGVLLRTEEGNAIGVCMRDDTLEINVIPKGSEARNWWRVDMQDGTIKQMTTPYEEGDREDERTDGEIPQTSGDSPTCSGQASPETAP